MKKNSSYILIIGFLWFFMPSFVLAQTKEELDSMYIVSDALAISKTSQSILDGRTPERPFCEVPIMEFIPLDSLIIKSKVFSKEKITVLARERKRITITFYCNMKGEIEAIFYGGIGDKTIPLKSTEDLSVITPYELYQLEKLLIGKQKFKLYTESCDPNSYCKLIMPCRFENLLKYIEEEIDNQ